MYLPNPLGNVYCTPLAADFDGDGKADPTVYNSANGEWTIASSSDGYKTVRLGPFGGTGWMPAGGDGDGDKYADFFVANLETGQWVVYGTTAGLFMTETNWLGQPGDMLALADYDGDGLADPAVFRLTEEYDDLFYVRRSAYAYRLAVFRLADRGYEEIYEE